MYIITKLRDNRRIWWSINSRKVCGICGYEGGLPCGWHATRERGGHNQYSAWRRSDWNKTHCAHLFDSEPALTASVEVNLTCALRQRALPGVPDDIEEDHDWESEVRFCIIKIQSASNNERPDLPGDLPKKF